MLSEQQISHFKSLLEKELQSTDKQIEQNNHFGLHEGESIYNYTGELSAYDNHPADTGTELFEREKDLAIEGHFKAEEVEITEALAAIEQGTYGKCKECGKDIPLERLEALPTAVTCVEHSPHQVVSDYRPVEEDVRNASVEVNHDNENVGFDEEDSWQSVAKWGNSDGPSDFFDPPAHYDQMYLNSDENHGYVEDIENSIGNDIDGKNIQIYPTTQLKEYEEDLDEEGIMTTFGDLKEFEQDPYVED
ncbi:TraR/DksA C4-type zinc finger protein [Cytobacillus purgationiresistens]|uniref:YteA family regulatory protein n=1 Tax=Cytobacillus purgationiresistens TaxID=863449 RepID=A0ABU0ACR1_9BACI|nr:TraR/DksA C4-type zinc finger protein [Cytobacillus purgationiresistens]MDQ0268506.1 YteA family regulatory protein [Cytobacillus purgationiresistens]